MFLTCLARILHEFCQALLDYLIISMTCKSNSGFIRSTIVPLPVCLLQFNQAGLYQFFQQFPYVFFQRFTLHFVFFQQGVHRFTDAGS